MTNYLLDSHTFLWWDIDDSRLSSRVEQILKAEKSSLFLSIASIWELQIKVQTGKLELTVPLHEKVQLQVETNGLHVLLVSPEHVYTLTKLPDYHRDPFDRMLIAQAMYENMVLISNDSQIAKYPIPVYW